MFACAPYPADDAFLREVRLHARSCCHGNASKAACLPLLQCKKGTPPALLSHLIMLPAVRWHAAMWRAMLPHTMLHPALPPCPHVTPLLACMCTHGPCRAMPCHCSCVVLPSHGACTMACRGPCPSWLHAHTLVPCHASSGGPMGYPLDVRFLCRRCRPGWRRGTMSLGSAATSASPSGVSGPFQTGLTVVSCMVRARAVGLCALDQHACPASPCLLASCCSSSAHHP